MDHSAGKIALGGVLAALSVVVMCLGGLIPIATFVCPMLCMVLLTLVLRSCGRRIAWAWYGTVTVLCALLSPDKEAAAVFAFLGYYPILKPKLDGLRLHLLWKLTLFNAAIGVMYAVLIHLLGMEQIMAEYQELGAALTVVMLFLGNITFLLMDRVLSLFSVQKKE